MPAGEGARGGAGAGAARSGAGRRPAGAGQRGAFPGGAGWRPAGCGAVLFRAALFRAVWAWKAWQEEGAFSRPVWGWNADGAGEDADVGWRFRRGRRFFCACRGKRRRGWSGCGCGGGLRCSSPARVVAWGRREVRGGAFPGGADVEDVAGRGCFFPAGSGGGWRGRGCGCGVVRAPVLFPGACGRVGAERGAGRRFSGRCGGRRRRCSPFGAGPRLRSCRGAGAAENKKTEAAQMAASVVRRRLARAARYSYCPDLRRSTSSRVRKRHCPRLRFFFVRPA